MSASPPEAPIAVWVVEDDALFRETIGAILDDADGMACGAAFGSAEAALEALEVDAPPDVVLMDIGLPGMSGIEGTRRLRAAVPTAEVVVLTVHEDDDKVFDAICAGASGYLLKPSSAIDLVAAVRTARRGGSPITPRIARRVLALFARTRAPADDGRAYGLTPREQEVLECLVDGMTKRVMAEHLFISPHTIDRHVRSIYAKLEVHTRASAVAKALSERLV